MNGGKGNAMSKWIFGFHPILETLRARPNEVREVLLARRGGERVREIERLAGGSGVTLRRVHRKDLDALADGLAHQGIGAMVKTDSDSGACAEVSDPAELVESAKEKGEPPLLLALDRIQDPRNLGALVRSAHAMGAHGVIIPRDRASEMTPAAVKASAGAAAHLPLCRVTNLVRALDDLKEAGLWVYGADVAEPRGAEGRSSRNRRGGRAENRGERSGPELPLMADEADLTGAVVLVIGAEGPGLRRLVRERCDKLVQIPMAGRIGSMNASVAGGILLYEVQRQRRAKKGG